MKDKNIEFITLLLLLVLTRVLDGILTFKITPDLSRELNPLVIFFGFGWTGLILVAAVIILPTVILNYYSIYKPFDNFPDTNVSFTDFKKFYFSSSNPALKHSSGKIIFQTLGYILPRVFILWGFWVIIHNYLVLVDEPFYSFLRKEFKIWLVGYLLPGVLGVMLTNPFLKHEYKRYINAKK